MTDLTATVFRRVNIGGRRYVIGLHPRISDPLISIREVARRVGYVVTVSKLRIEGALAFGRAELAAKRAARKNGVRWSSARRVFLSSIIPPTVKRKGGAS